MKLIYLKGQYYLLSTDDIKKGEVFLYLKQYVMLAENDINVHDNTTHSKIIGASNEYGFKNEYNIPLLDKENIEALLPNGFDVDALAKEYAENENSAYTNDYYGFKAGFKKHKELTSDKKWTDADMLKAMTYAMNKRTQSIDDNNLNIHLYIDGRNKEISEWEAEIELDNKNIDLETPNDVSDFFKPKITTNGYITITKIK